MRLISDIHFNTLLDGCQRLRSYIDDDGMLWLHYSLRDKPMPFLNVKCIGTDEEIAAQIGQVFSQELGYTGFFFRQGTNLQMQLCLTRHKWEAPE